MKLLFIHQNMPGQYKHLVRHFAARGDEVTFITKPGKPDIAGVRKVTYSPQREPGRNTHHYLSYLESAVLHGQQVARVCLALKKSGWRPDIICAHPGWGEALFVKDVFEDSPLLSYCEFFYRAHGADVNFDPREPTDIDGLFRIRAKNCNLITSLDTCDRGIAPTWWQKRAHPAEYWPKIAVIHEGVDTAICKPDPAATITLPGGRKLTRADEVVTYVARNLEPYRGFPIFMRALDDICRRRPNATILVVGGDDVSYGRAPSDAKNWREKMLREVTIDPARVIFLGRVPYGTFLSILRLSRAHIYLTYPFVLSWSMLEAMATGCPIVGSRTGPVVEVVEDRVNGLLADFFQPAEVADRVVELLEDHDLRARVSERARETVVARYDLRSRCLPQQIELIEEMAGGRQA